MAVQPVFELGGSIFNSLTRLQGLIAATAEDDVHVQAVLAVEQLGALIPAAPERIGEAVDALGGQTSVKVENLQAYIGISSGGLCRTMRQSTPLLQFFLLCSACKMAFIDEDCGSLIFEMLKTSTVLARFPCSASQIERMINQFSGQGDKITPIELMHEVAVGIDRFNPDQRGFQNMESKALAELLMKLFEHIKDESIDSLILTGHHNCVLLASTLFWLMGDQACIIVNKTLLKGDRSAKLSIYVEPTDTVPWSLQIFRKSKDLTEYVFDVPYGDVGYFSRQPLRSLKQFFNQYHFAACSGLEYRTKMMTASGVIAQTLLLAVSRRGLLYLQCSHCEELPRCNIALLSAVAQSSWLEDIERLIMRYGWGEDIKCDPALLAAILHNVDELRVPGAPILEADCFDTFRKVIEEPCRRYLDAISTGEGKELQIDHILQIAHFVAADAAVTCTLAVQNGGRYIQPSTSHEMLVSTTSTISNLLSCGIEVSKFRELAFMHLLPGLEAWQDGSVVIEKDGYVAGWNVLWATSIQQSDALAIRMQQGGIKKDGVRYSQICERPDTVTGGRTAPAFDPVQGLVTTEF